MAERVLYSSPLSETFSYDGATNLALRTGPAATYTLDGANRVTADGSRSFVWDGADRLIQRGPDTFSYDPLGRLTSSAVRISVPPSADDAPRTLSETYAYDGDGLLRSRAVTADDHRRPHRHDDEDDGRQSTAFLWDASLAPAPLLVAGTERVVQGLGPLYLVRANDHTTTLVRDALGSVRAETNSKGAITKAFRYRAYGALRQRLPASAPPTLLGFAGGRRARHCPARSRCSDPPRSGRASVATGPRHPRSCSSDARQCQAFRTGCLTETSASCSLRATSGRGERAPNAAPPHHPVEASPAT